jgi:phage I-like protein
MPIVRVGEKTLACLSANQRRLGFDRIALDYEHNTVPGSAEYKRTQEPRPIAAHGMLSVVRGEGLYLEDAAWTPDGPKAAANYPDVSPTPMLDPDTHEVVFVHSVALTRAGAGDGLRFPMLSIEVNTQGDTRMDPKLKALLCRLLKKPEDSKDDDIASALENLGLTVSTLSAADLPGKLTLLSTTLDGQKTAIQTMTSQVQALDASLKTLSADMTRVRKSILVRDAVALGKQIPLDAAGIESMEIATLSTLLDKLPDGVVPLAARTPRAPQEPGAAGDQAALDKVARLCGMDPEQVRKANGLK